MEYIRNRLHATPRSTEPVEKAGVHSTAANAERGMVLRRARAVEGRLKVLEMEMELNERRKPDGPNHGGA
jgi:hypothetical protein